MDKTTSLQTIYDIDIDTDSNDSTYYPSSSESDDDWDEIESLDSDDDCVVMIDKLPKAVKQALIKFIKADKNKKSQKK